MHGHKIRVVRMIPHTYAWIQTKEEVHDEIEDMRSEEEKQEEAMVAYFITKEGVEEDTQLVILIVQDPKAYKAYFAELEAQVGPSTYFQTEYREAQKSDQPLKALLAAALEGM